MIAFLMRENINTKICQAQRFYVSATVGSDDLAFGPLTLQECQAKYDSYKAWYGTAIWSENGCSSITGLTWSNDDWWQIYLKDSSRWPYGTNNQLKKVKALCQAC